MELAKESTYPQYQVARDTANVSDKAARQRSLRAALDCASDVATAKSAYNRALAILDKLEREQKLTEAQQNWPNLVRQRLAQLP